MMLNFKTGKKDASGFVYSEKDESSAFVFPSRMTTIPLFDGEHNTALLEGNKSVKSLYSFFQDLTADEFKMRWFNAHE